MAVTSREVGKELCEALALPLNRVQSIDLSFHAGEIVTATVRLMPERDQLDKVLSVLKSYELHEKTSQPDQRVEACT